VNDRTWTLKTGSAERSRLVADVGERALAAAATAEADEICFVVDTSDIAAHQLRDAVSGDTLAQHTGVVVGTMKIDAVASFLATWNASWHPGDEDKIVDTIDGITGMGLVPVFVVGGGGSMVATLRAPNAPVANAWSSWKAVPS
jgi:hypothetical protein